MRDPYTPEEPFDACDTCGKELIGEFCPHCTPHVLAMVESQLATVTAERDALKAQLETAMMDPNTVFDSPQPSAVDVFVELRQRFGQHFDTIEDVEEWVAKQRRGE